MALDIKRDDEVLRKLEETASRIERLEKRLSPLLELREDLQPIIKEAFHALILELDELDGHFKLEDALALIKKLLRNTKRLTSMVERIEQFDDLIRDMTPIIHEATKATIKELGEIERQGVFKNLMALRTVAERFSRRFTPDRVVEIGDGIIELTMLVDQLTQPRTMHLLRTAADATSGDGRGREQVTLRGIFKRMRHPDTLRGLALMLDVAQALGRADDTENKPMLDGD